MNSRINYIISNKLFAFNNSPTRREQLKELDKKARSLVGLMGLALQDD